MFKSSSRDAAQVGFRIIGGYISGGRGGYFQLPSLESTEIDRNCEKFFVAQGKVQGKVLLSTSSVCNTRTSLFCRYQKGGHCKIVMISCNDLS